MNKDKTLLINTRGLKLLADSNLLKEFAVFLYLKSLYSNSCIFNYTQSSLAAKSKLPLSSIKSNVKLFIDSGWCRMHRGNLIFNKVKEFCHTKRITRKRIAITNPKQILDDLYKLILEHAEDKFKILTKISADLLSSHPKIRRSAEKKADRLNLDINKLPGASDLISLSMKKISQLLGVSVGKAASIIKRFKTDGSIWCVTERKVITDPWIKWKPKTWLEYNTGHYYHNGMLFKVCCNKYKFNK